MESGGSSGLCVRVQKHVSDEEMVIRAALLRAGVWPLSAASLLSWFSLAGLNRQAKPYCDEESDREVGGEKSLCQTGRH